MTPLEPGAHPKFVAASFALVVATAATSAQAETYQVAPDGDYPSVQALMDAVTLLPGDIVEVEGDHTYPGDLWFEEEVAGDEMAPVTIRGVRKNGHRPVLSGVGTEEWHDMVVFLAANHLVFEGFEIVGDDDPAHTCVITQGHEIVVRDVYVHGCEGHGLLATDWGTGNLTIEHSEFTDSGSGDYKHQIYVTTDQAMYPGTRVRIQFNYIHDASGGLNIKSRAERTEIYFNWIEAAVLNDLDLIGPDAEADDAREDSDVVGNVIVHTSPYSAARIGDDGTNGTDGRYRFAYNTFVFDGSDGVAIRPQVNIESLEIYNNAFLSMNGAAPRFYRLTEYTGSDPIVMGSHNFIDSAYTDVPAELTDTLDGDPGIMDLEGLDLRLADGSPLIDAGTEEPVGPSNAIPNPLVDLTYVPPPRTEPTSGMPYDRNEEGGADIGAYALGSGTEPGPGGPPPQGAGPSGSTGSGNGSSAGASGDDGGCHVAAPGRSGNPSWLWLVGLGLLAWRRD
jgi:hypothetical protein